MKRDYNVLAFRTTDLVFHKVFEAESQDGAISKMVDYLRQGEGLTQEKVEELRFISCPENFNGLKEVKNGEIKKID